MGKLCFSGPLENLPYIQVSISHCDDIGFSVAFPEAHPMGADVEKAGGETEEAVFSQLTDKEKMLPFCLTCRQKAAPS